MAETSYPFYGVETNETQFSKWARALVYDGILSGLTMTAGAGMTVSLAVGSAMVRGLYYENYSTAKSLPVAAAPGSGTRLDAVILKLDQDANTITALVKTGSIGALPALTQNDTVFELLIGVVTVAAGTVSLSNAMIAATRPTTGLRVLHYTSDDLRPSNPGMDPAIGIQTTAKRLDLWIGGAWVNLSHLDNMSGVLPVSKGGTGSNSALAARSALEIKVQTTDPGHAEGRVWIRA